MPTSYSLSSLYKLRSCCGYPPSHIIPRLKQLNIFHSRGRRGGRNVIRKIPVIKPRKRTPNQPTEKKTYNHVQVPRIWYDLPSLLLSNVTSLANKLDEVIVTVKEFNCDIVAITECWQIVPEQCQIENYDLFHCLRDGRRGGGVALYCRKHLAASPLEVSVPEGLEALWLRLTPPTHPHHTASIIYCLVYHPPRSATGPALINHIIESSDELKLKFPSSKIVICGDLNQLNINEILEQLHLTQVVGFPTNINSNNTLDLILTDLGDQYLPPKPLPPMGKSNHLCVYWSATPTIPHQHSSIIRTHRPTPDSAIREFGQWLVNYPWTEVLTVDDVNTKWENFSTTATRSYHHFFPTKRTKMHPTDVPWITPRIKKLITQRNKAFFNMRGQYRRLRNKVIREIRRAKKTYYPTRIHNLKQANTNQWFSKIKDLCGISKQSSPIPCVSQLQSNEAAIKINTHFSTICQTLPKLNHNRLPAYLPSPSPPPIIQEYEVANKLSKFKSKRSTTPVDLPMKIYKEFAAEFATPLCSIINASLQQSKCPAEWKTSYVTPIPKTPSPKTLSELRPIAITPIPSLICEDFVFNLAYSQISHLIDPQQFGNIKSSSTTHCLISFLNFIYSNLEKRKTSLALAFIDFRKAFDLVDHTTIINKALKLGLHPHLVSWLADFLSNRRQAVRYQGSTSTFQDLTCGVPQGTKMGPLCFLILINDALEDTPYRWKYVDDSTVGITVNNNSPDYAPLQHTLDRLQAWTSDNHVSINHDKTMVMHIHTSSTDLTPPAVTIGPHPLKVVTSTKLLGVTVDNKLNWKQHITTTIRISTYKLYMLRRLRSLGAPDNELKFIYTLFILPKLSYASPAWSSSLTITLQQQLERVQKRAFRIILGPAYSGYDEALSTLNLPSLTTHYHNTLKNFATKLLHNPRHRNLLPPDNTKPTRSARHYNKIQPIKPRTDRYKHSPIPTIVSLLNNM